MSDATTTVTDENTTTLSDLDLGEMWRSLVVGEFATPESAFIELVQSRLADPEEAERIGWCADCQKPVIQDEMYFTGNEDNVCESCADDYQGCYRCDNLYRHTTTNMDGHEICSTCLNEEYSYCDICEGWFYSDDGCQGEHTCGCDVPRWSFSISNGTDGPLHNDERVIVSLPAGHISQEGMYSIRDLIQSARYTMPGKWTEKERAALIPLSYALPELGTRWQTKEGNLTKRLSRLAYKKWGLKVPPDVLTQVGNLARQHSVGADYAIEVTRDLNLSADDFYHEDSCWWGSHASSMCAFKSNGGFGMRTFNNYSVTGRAWVMPLKVRDGGLVPTFETMSPDAFVVFNGYGDLEGYTPARIMAQMSGMTYRKVDFSTQGSMYVNGDSGYLVAPEEIAAGYTEKSLSFDAPIHSDLHDTEGLHHVA